ncbi:glycosyltransferase [Sphingomonas quercus]|uniref:Glycosyltransferase n=1 Tax=Sphingomonas quercus TaxID=2842451 RepID=A0ABS6BFW7_9SPHN|nr:glycosyltransferase [Sphingomonas quercus]MBU3077190.1 glycosyltransferase [Sphingomonas quercus]
MDGAMSGGALGIVVIGRNEGARLIRCLASIDMAAETVYVDSGSTDGSVEAARARGLQVVALDMTRPFTAARARNAGRAALSPGVRIVQFVDGDCAIQPGWLAAAQAALAEDPGLAAVFGRRREIAPEATRYNWLCDVEWAVPPGPARYFGGDVMLRAGALDAAGGYPDEMIAGEEPDLAHRLRAQSWRIACLPREMTLHDAAITRFGQWWRRTVRSGHAYAELADRHGGDYRRRCLGVAFWGAVVPVAGLAALAAGLIAGPGWLPALGGAILLLPLVQLLRLFRREARRRPLDEAMTLATFLMLAKPAQFVGMARYWRGRVGGRRSALIEYKGGAA